MRSVACKKELLKTGSCQDGSCPEKVGRVYIRTRSYQDWRLSGKLRLYVGVFTTGSCQDGSCPEVKMMKRGLLKTRSYQDGSCPEKVGRLYI